MTEFKGNELVMDHGEFLLLLKRIDELSQERPTRYEEKALKRAKYFARLGL